ncbi:metal ABC transporter substrate-binding protein [Rhizobium sp. KAs_5_22]|uniref:metal ABC transporter substrate-binding protein n=1 Tax=Ciceribacter selenitireducens TaxID=448181 RepID=UPI00048D5F41|nr:metal ABC transporter substrate-binding protein [Ciceribacter selenitireducens]PPJ45486.1 metal ABC transporter substrate-binding protein [Rhizobium sp. KAs_5_22]
MLPRIAGFLAAAIILLPLGAAAAEKPKVITTFTVIADIARNVAGDMAEVDSITKPGAEIHNYQPTPRDILKARDADLVLWNGLNLERWFEKFLANLGSVPAAVISDGVQPISISGGGYDGKPNPHAWMSPDNALIYVENIRKALAEVDPDHAEAYAANAKAYSDKIRAEIEPMKAQIAALPAEKRWLVTSEGAFSYLARDLGLKELFLWPVNADAQGTPQQVRAVIDAMRENRIAVIFSESTISDKPARQVAEETGAAYGGVLYVDSLSEEGGPVPTYLDLLKVTVSTIAEGLAR